MYIKTNSDIRYHLIFYTQNREPVITRDLLQSLSYDSNNRTRRVTHPSNGNVKGIYWREKIIDSVLIHWYTGRGDAEPYCI